MDRVRWKALTTLVPVISVLGIALIVVYASATPEIMRPHQFQLRLPLFQGWAINNILKDKERCDLALALTKKKLLSEAVGMDYELDNVCRPAN